MGSFLPLIFERYKDKKHVTLDLVDIDENSIEILKVLLKKFEIPKNFTINIQNEDFLFYKAPYKYDLIIGNPPFLKLNKQKLKKYDFSLLDNVTKNLAGLFTKKSMAMADRVLFILPKYFLSNSDFKKVREEVGNYCVEEIIDFGENGFKGVLIETIFLNVNTKKAPDKTKVKSISLNKENIIKQHEMTDSFFPYWLIYRDENFNSLIEKMDFDIFDVFRDRQITNKLLSEKGDVWVIKSRNITRDGLKIQHIDGYDSFIKKENLKGISISKFLDDENVFLAPNMTYYPRVIRKPKNTIVNGSVAVLLNKTNKFIKDSDLKFFASNEFENFYRVARNFSTRSLNIDKQSVFFFGLLTK
ncbi:methyltransferase [Staphylococcus pseudintermedius]|nr:DNA methyltransferase [Staphylococcus pseudintermedius]EGQ1772199.1 DNA methyltransferase [Staphylococcus pseudintermedius]EGQ2702569.1 methyltransferase [Staphylococcus pseudintermedius]EGQ3053482.1 methyltransferase [Staphylococcus pseudintermedius]EGQ3088066.1 methyltransferase [Staphylococcus pseudintermedius]